MRFDLVTRTLVEKDIGADVDAIIGADRTLNWRDFAQAVQAWTDQARQHGISADVPILIRGHKEADFMVAIAGALSLRAPFVPVDTIYPDERLHRIAAALDVCVLYDAVTGSFQTLQSGTPKALAEKELAYVLFTSGTTGEPKGVQIGSDSVQLLVDWMATDFAFGDQPVFMNQAPFSFDLSMYEVFATLALGGTAILISRALLAQPAEFIQTLATHAATVWVSTPSLVQQQLLNQRFNQQGLPALRTFLFCGEVLANSLARALRTRFPDAQVINTYGPTEATVATTWLVIDDAVIAQHPILPIGYAKRDSDVFIEDGELCIAGENVMRGYLNRADLNATRMFERNGQRGFRTGDLGSIDVNGLLFCHGRIDEQIKIAGYRIELLEIDVALSALPGERQAAVVPLRRADGSVARMIAFIETGATHDAFVLPDELKDWRALLAATLPSYMIPSELMGCAKLPVSVNFKIDRTQLAQDYQDAYRKRSPS
jgi:D-alanine--poly(phosphoribitol) ligase subunit 1